MILTVGSLSLSQFKTPLRNVLGEAEEAVQNTISRMIQQIIQRNDSLKVLNQEVTRLQKLCTDNNVSFTPTPQNRKERRVEEREQTKEVELTPNIKN